jgi:hypothetical protein
MPVPMVVRKGWPRSKSIAWGRAETAASGRLPSLAPSFPPDFTEFAAGHKSQLSPEDPLGRQAPQKNLRRGHVRGYRFP